MREEATSTVHDAFIHSFLLELRPMTTAPLWPSAREAVASYGALMWKQVLLLGFDVGEYARKEGIRDADALGPRMFHSQSPNRAGLFAVLHFLFSKFSEDFARVYAAVLVTGCWRLLLLCLMTSTMSWLSF